MADCPAELFARGCEYAAAGRTLEARDAYLALLAREPGHRLALNNLGTLLHESGHRTAAHTAYAEAVARHPDDPMSRVNLGNALYQNNDPAAAREHFEAALRVDPEYAQAHQGLARVLAELGDLEGAQAHGRAGYAGRAVNTIPYRGNAKPVRLLLLVSSTSGNIPLRHLLDDRVFETTVIVPEFYDPDQPLPPHDLVFNSIGDADLCANALELAGRLLALTRAPVINPPQAVMTTRRVDLERLAGLASLIVPCTMTLPRAAVTPALLSQHGFDFPLLVRSPGYHTGRHFDLVESAAALSQTVERLPGKELTVIEFLDARGPDGKTRKYRVMIIDGQLYPLHVAIASYWKIHYFTAEMADRPDHRAEDREFLENMPRVLGPRAMQTLLAIQAALGLDYGGIDFGLNAVGEVLLFEANATMVVNPPELDERWAYRRPAVDRIFAAVRNMLTATLR